jgi:cytochrome P450
MDTAAMGNPPIGANLARAEIRVVLEELFRRLSDIHVADPAARRRSPSALVMGIEHLPARFTPESQQPAAFAP